MAKIEYPLKQVLEIKQKRVEDAEKVVIEKRAILEKEQKTLAQREAERDKVKQHRQDKLDQLRAELDHGTTSPKVQQMKAYSKVVDERLKGEEKKVKDQKVKVEAAEKDLEEAKSQLRIKRQEVDKLVMHREGWQKEIRKELELAEEKVQEEIGNVIYGMHHKKSDKQSDR